MTLRTRLILATTAVVTLLFGVSEWLSYRHITTLLDQHETILTETTDHSVALERLRYTRDHALLSATSIRILYAAGTLVVAVAILNLVWYRTIYRPIRELLKQINIMGRGTWKCPLPVRRDDEIGELTTAFNHLGQELTTTFEHINASSKLSALALIGGRVVREVIAVRGRIADSSRGLESGTAAGIAAAAANLEDIESRLATLEAGFQETFEEELSSISAGATTSGGGRNVMGPFTNILVDFDATASAQPGLELARRIARRCEARLRAVDGAASVSARRIWRGGRALATEAVSSNLADALIGEVERFGHDLVIRSQARDVATRGDVNVQLFRRCPCPVWALGAAPLPVRPKIVAAVNATDPDPVTRALNAKAIDLALLLAELDSGSAIVLQAWSPVAEKQLYVHTTRAEFDGSLCRAEERAARDIAALAASFGPRLDGARVELRRGLPEEVIPEFLVAEGVDILVAGARRRTGVWHGLFGSTTERLLGATPCSLIAVKADGLAAARFA